MTTADSKRYLVSAIVSTYGAERFLRGKLEDLEAQTIADRLEIIVIDSASPEGEGAIAAEFQKRYDNIRYLRTERRETVYQAWNRGIRMATGEFVTNANTDDRLRRDAYETLVRVLVEHPECVLAYPDMRITRDENASFENHVPFGFRDWPPYDRRSLLELCCVGPFPLWRRSLHEEIGYFDERYKSAADYEFWLRASEKHDFVHVPEFLGLYWLSEQTVSRKGDLPTLEYLQVQKEYRAKFARFAPALAPLSESGQAEFQSILPRIRALEAAAQRGTALTPAPLPEGEGEVDSRMDEGVEGYPKDAFGTLEGVCGELERFCERHPDFPAAQHQLAQLYYKRGEIGYAKKHFEKAVLLDPGSREYAEALRGFFRLELYQSLQHYTSRLAAQPDDLETRLSAGMTCILLERHDAARVHYRKALGIDPENPLAAGNLAYLDRLAPIATGSTLGINPPCPPFAKGGDVEPALNSIAATPTLPAATSPGTPKPEAPVCKGAIPEAPLCKGGDVEPALNSMAAPPAHPPAPTPAPKPAPVPATTPKPDPALGNSPSPLAGEGRGEGEGYFGFSRPELRRMVSRRARRILDVGCAEGKVGAALKERQGAEVWGIEMEARAAAMAANVLDRVITAPVEQALAELPERYFDCIVLADILEHLVDPAAVLAKLAEKLAPAGELVASLPNVAHWSVVRELLAGSWEYREAGILDRTHLKFFTRKSALALFESAGFTATAVTPIALAGETVMPPRLVQALEETGLAGPELARESAAYQYLFRLARPEALITSIVILTYNEVDCTRECLESIARNTPEPHEVILVDNGSSDGTLPYLRELCASDNRLSLIENGRNLGFAAGCNLGMRRARGGRIVLLNNDVVVTHGWLGGMLECLEREPRAGMVGPMSNEVAGPQRVAGSSYRTTDELEDFSALFGREHRGRRIPVPRLVGFCLLIAREVLEQVGELDETFGSGNFEDDDLCLRAALTGFGCVIASDVFIHHYGSRSFKANGIDYSRAMAENRARYDAKWELGRLDESLAHALVTRNAITRGRELASRGQLDAAVDLLLQQGIRFSPQSCEPYLALAEILVDAGKFRDALEVLENLPLQPDIGTLVLIGRCHRGLGDLPRALESAELVLRCDPECAGALKLKGSVALDRGESEAARELLGQGITADPGFGPCYTALSRLFPEPDQALELARTGFVLSPLDMGALARFHELACDRHVLAAEEECVRAAREIFPEHQGLAFGLIEILIRRGAWAGAMAEIEGAAAQFGMDDGMIDAALAVRTRAGAKRPEQGRGLISLCMIVKDEARHLPNLLHSVGRLIDEIVVVDTGSTDRTADIARVFGARVSSFPWSGSFSKARNFSLRQASCDWILVLDADEALAPEDLPPLRALVERATIPTAYSFTTRNYTEAIARRNWTANAGEYPREERGRGWTPSEKVRLFPNDGRLLFQGAVHELLEPALMACGIPIHACDVPVHHYGKLDAEKSRLKQEQYYRLGLKKLSETGGDPASLSELARQATELERFAEAEELWYRILEDSPQSAEAHFNLGYLHLCGGDYSRARGHALKAAELAPELKEAAFNLAKSELFLGDPGSALKRSQAILESCPDYPPALSLLCAASIAQGLRAQGEKALAKLVRMGFDKDDFLSEYADGLVRGGREDLAALLRDARSGPDEDAGDPPTGGPEVQAHAGY